MKRITSFLIALVLALSMCGTALAASSADQITNSGGTSESSADKVSISKTIAGTGIENVFDITLTVKTDTDVGTITQDPDLAVVIVMDISETMNTEFGSTTRYKAAIASANHFINDFQRDVGSKSSTSKIGFVSFNTSSQQAAPMTTVSTTAQATNFKNTVKNACDKIINADGYRTAHTRFTNIESGLKRGYDMIKNMKNNNKFIIFLSDGFPTTYIKSGYTGYDPYDPNATSYTEGHFYDGKIKCPCSYGTSYSDRAAIKARQQATTIKNAGVEIFSIGIDVGGQTIKGYDTWTHSDGFGVIDRKNDSSYEIGSYSSASAYKDWLKGSASNNTTGIGSGYYYDSTNQAGMDRAFATIFEEMKTKAKEKAASAWRVTDPLGPNQEFIGFFNKSNVLQATNVNLSGSNASGAEDTATYNSSSKQFVWDLKKSGWSKSGSTYTYQMKYRVRLTNEAASGFAENTSYNTNGTTPLTYMVYTTSGGATSVSPQKTMNAKIPAVKGYLGDLTFQKKDQYENSVAGAKFSLEHDPNCNKCRGSASDPKAVPNNGNLAKKESTSSAAGKVTFSKIPSGHTYVLKEVSAPVDYTPSSDTWKVTVAYDKVTVSPAIDTGVVNPLKEHEIRLKKVDAMKQDVTLAGAEFVLYSDEAMRQVAKEADGTEVSIPKTGADGIVTIGTGKLRNGTYYLKETVAPSGYVNDPLDYVKITITNTAGDPTVTAITKNGAARTVERKTDPATKKTYYEITLPNNPGAELPATGGPGTLLYTLSGTVLLLGSALLYGFRARQKERRSN